MKIHYSEPFKLRFQWAIDKIENSVLVEQIIFDTKNEALDFLKELTITVYKHNSLTLTYKTI